MTRAGDDDFADRELSPALAVGEGDIDVSLRPRSLGNSSASRGCANSSSW